MSVQFTFRPLDHATWPDDGQRYYKSCQFRAPYSRTMRELQDEMRRIGVSHAVIEADVSERHVRLDGQLRADAKPDTPRVRLSFHHPNVGPLQYPCDTYANWQDNLRAIVKTLEAQRAMERYGATRRHQQYTGWKQLPGAIELHGPMTVEQAAQFMATVHGWCDASLRSERGAMIIDRLECAAMIIDSPEEYRRAYLHAAKVLHPDAGGDVRQFQQLQHAKRVLDEHHDSRGAL